MSGQIPLVFADAEIGNRLCVFSRDTQEMERLFAAFCQQHSESHESVVFISDEQIEQDELTRPDQLYRVILEKAGMLEGEGSGRVSVFIHANRIASDWRENGLLEQQFADFDQWAAQNACVSVWCLMMADVDQRLLDAIFNTESKIAVGDNLFIDRRRQESTGVSKLTPASRTEAGDNEARFRAFFNTATLGIVILNMDGGIRDCNPAFDEMIGYPHSDILGRNFAIFAHPEDVWIDLDMQNFLSRERAASFQGERRFVTKDGRWARGRITASLFMDITGSQPSILVFVEDVTTRWQLESELIEVQRRLMQNREMERLRLAQDLHDSLLQDLYGLGFNLKDLLDTTSDIALHERLTGLQVMLQRQIHELRTFCNELRPPTLAPFGLEKAIRSYTENFRVSHPGIRFQLDLMADGQALPEPVRLALFRVYQEMLSNIARHSGADAVTVRFRLEPDQVELEIADNGQGFEVPERWVNLARKGHFGLVGAQERAEAIGGKMLVWSQPGEGTVINISIPVNLTSEDTWMNDQLN
ncbi:MAG TPA: PAS domain-containing sensor histidine kinase [Anaerolineaceae bacterium]|nr:PAS domain-containing sensor histidine kinase [Anaerolineaceae bacterium]